MPELVAALEAFVQGYRRCVELEGGNQGVGKFSLP